MLLPDVFRAAELRSVGRRLDAVLNGRQQESVLRSRGQTYGSRNLLEVFPEVAELVRAPALAEFVGDVLGPNAGLV